MIADFKCYHLPNGVRLFFWATPKFKTVSIAAFIHQELNSKLAALGALLPAVLKQGSRLYPDYLTMQRNLENMYGANLDTDIIKIGERHILSFFLEVAHGKYALQNGQLFRQGLHMLGSVIGDPLVDHNGFKTDYVEGEKKQLIKEINALINDKAAYTLEKCIALMCHQEKFGVYRLGGVVDYHNIDSPVLYHYYREVLSHNPIDLYIIGDLNEDDLLEPTAEYFNFDNAGKRKVFNDSDVGHKVKAVKSIEETLTVNQTRLVLGFRTNTGYSDILFFALLVYSGILGGFPHSKLFMKVREESALAYYINSRLEPHKGLMFISAGINYSELDQVKQIIALQIEEMNQGQISLNELEFTRQGLINQVRSRQDSPSRMISSHLSGSIGGKIYTSPELIDGIMNVSLEDLKKVADRIKLDTEYLLGPGEGDIDNVS